ncbi:MAG: hypothetical protein Q9213_005667 [Squamulea squamosa]
MASVVATQELCCPQEMIGSNSDLSMTIPFSTAPNEAHTSWLYPEQPTFFPSQPGLPVVQTTNPQGHAFPLPYFPPLSTNPSLPPTQHPAGLSSQPLYAAESVASATRSPVVFPTGSPTRKRFQEARSESNVPTEGPPDYEPSAFINWDDPNLF